MTFGSKMTHPSSKTRISALEKLKQSNAAKLELETRKMEERIRSLKEKMMKEKEERERLGGSRWTSGRTGPLTKNIQKSPGSKKNQSNGTINKVPRKIKVLTDEPVDKYMRKPRPVPVCENPVDLCGQCEKIPSAWNCHECSEKYCNACFNQFHLKGALRRHTKTRVGAESPEEAISLATPRQKNLLLRSYGATTDTPSMKNDHMNGPSLLNGSYDEEESANSFAQALQEWRNQNNAAKITERQQPVCSDISCGTSNLSVNDHEDKKELMIKFNSSISYGDRLYLKKNRENCFEPVELPKKINEGEKNVRREAKGNDISKNDSRLGFEREEKENESVDHFAPNYREMVQNIITVKPETDISSIFQEDNIPPQRALSFEEVSPLEFNTQDEQESTCIVEECEEAVTDQARPSSRHGAVTICEMYSSRDYEGNLTKKLNQSTTDTFDTNNFVSSSITSKPFFLKPTGKVKTTNQPVRAVSAGRRKPSHNGEQRQISLSSERQSAKPSSKKRQHDEGLPLRQGIDINVSLPNQTNKTNKQTPLIKGKEKEILSNRSHLSPRPPENKLPTKNKTRISIRQAWKPKPTHKELSGFFLAGVDERIENFPSEEIYSERSSSSPITNLGRGCLSSTWNPVKSYPQVSTGSIDISPSMQLGTSTPEKRHYQRYQTSAFEECSSSVAEIDSNSGDLRLTSHKNEELEGLPIIGVSKDTTKNNSSNEEEELLQLTALDDFGTGNQDDDDFATLNDLAWELASSTGRLTRCEEDFHVDSDNDSIEDRDDGSGLTTPSTLNTSAKFRESIMDDFEEMERKFMEEEF